MCSDDARFEKEKGRDDDPVEGEIKWDVIGERKEDDTTFESQNGNDAGDRGKESPNVLCDQRTVRYPPQSS